MKPGTVPPSTAAGPRRTDAVFAVIAVLVAALALLMYAAFIERRAINVPFHDDIVDVLGFMLNFEDAGSLRERVDLVLARYNDHRTGAARILYLAMRSLTGEIDFRALTFVANLSVPLLALLYSQTVRPGLRMLAFGFAVLMACNPRGRDFLLWPMSELAFHGVIVYALAALLALRRSGWAPLAVAAACAGLAMQSLASGQLAWLAGMAMLVLRHRRDGSQGLDRLIAWIALSVLALIAFHWGFANPNPPATIAGFLLGDPAYQATYVLVVLGSALGFGSVSAAAITGGCLLGALLLLTPGAVRTRQDVLLCMGWYLLASVLAVALGRAPYSDLGYALDPRYGVFSVALVITLVLLAGERLGFLRGWAGLALLLVADGYCLASYAAWTGQTDVAMKQRVAVYNTGRFPAFGRAPAVSQALVERAIERGIYVPPARPLELPGSGTP